MYEPIKDKGHDLDKMLTPTSGYSFFNISRFTFTMCMGFDCPMHYARGIRGCGFPSWG